jgi:hypothetical protein
LADTLPTRLRALGVSEESADKAVENTALDARRLGLLTNGGHIGKAFPVEWAAMRAYPEQWPLNQWPVKAVMLLLALALPPKLFYYLRGHYSILRKAAGRALRISA